MFVCQCVHVTASRKHALDYNSQGHYDFIVFPMELNTKYPSFVILVTVKVKCA